MILYVDIYMSCIELVHIRILDRRPKDHSNPGWINADVATIVPVLKGIAESVKATFESTCMQCSSMLALRSDKQTGQGVLYPHPFMKPRMRRNNVLDWKDETMLRLRSLLSILIIILRND